jgi:hypothetical protein
MQTRPNLRISSHIPKNTGTDERWQGRFALKFHGYVRMMLAAWPHLRESTRGIVNSVGICSVAGSANSPSAGRSMSLYGVLPKR